MPALPHKFPTLRGEGTPHRRSLLVIGSGMSLETVPSHEKLLADKRAQAEKQLQVSPTPSVDKLYNWAGQIIDALKANGEPNPKLRLAQSLGIPSDPCWQASVSGQRSAPAHRVIARFARENLWQHIWSLNWDCLQENALENVGIRRSSSGTDSGANVPWPTIFCTAVLIKDIPKLAQNGIVKLIKPHGCAHALREAEAELRKGNTAGSLELADRFLITDAELRDLESKADNADTQQFIFEFLRTNLCMYPLVIAGWSASEPYLCRFFATKVKSMLQGQQLGTDALSIIDPVFNDDGHKVLSECYSKTKDTAHIPVDTGTFTSNDLFLWLQALYAIGRLSKHAIEADKQSIDAIAQALTQPPDSQPSVIQWVDNFLPAWVRLCWRCGLVEYYQGNRIVPPESIPMDKSDEHIPWNLQGPPRRDLQTAATLLAALVRSTRRNKWDFQQFPGGFYDEEDLTLVIPLPAWGSTPPNDRYGLKMLSDAVERCGVEYIQSLSILPVSTDSSASISDATKNALKELVASQLPRLRFTGDKISIVRLEDI